MSLFDKLRELFGGEREKIEIERIENSSNMNNMYDITLDSHSDKNEIIEDREIKVYSPELDELFTGSWVREKLESQRREKQITPDEDPSSWRKKYNDSKIWVGYKKNGATSEPEGIGLELESFEQHGAVFGKTGTGKSTLLRIIALQMIQMGYGLTFISPKDQEDIVNLLQMIPENRYDDVVSIRYKDGDDYVPCINYLDTFYSSEDDEMISEAEWTLDTGRAIAKAQVSSWGSIIGNVFDSYLPPMAISDRDFTPVDVQKLLTNKDKREKFVNYVREEIDTIRDDYNYATSAEKLAEYDNDDMNAAERRFNMWLNSSYYRLIKNKESTINFDEVINKNKILLVDLEGKSNSFKSTVSIVIIRSLWNAIRRRNMRTEQYERQPYYAIVDEFDSVVTKKNYKEMEIQTIISEARSYGFHLIAASQYPSQLPEAVKKELNGNIKNMMAMNVGEYSDQRTLAEAYSDVGNVSVSASDIAGLDDYKLFLQRSNDEPPQKINTFPDYPYLISSDRAKRILDKSQKEYGYPVNKDTQMTILDDIFAEMEGRKKEEEGITTEQELMAKMVGVAQYYDAAQEGNYSYELSDNRWVSIDILEDVVEVVDELDIDDVTYWVNSESHGLKIQNTHNGAEVKLDETGEMSGYELAKQQDSGASGSAGKVNHRLGLTDIRKEFARIGIAVTIPMQGGEELPDGIAYNFGLEDEYVEDLFKRENETMAHIEKEETTLDSKKGQTIKNLAKAAQKGVNCIFVVSDGEEKFTENAEKGDKIKNGGIRNETEDGSLLYNLGDMKKRSSRSIKTPVRPRQGSNKRTYWFEKNGEYILKDNNGIEHARLQLEDLKNNSWTIEDFPAYYTKNNDKYIVRNSETGEVKERYNSEQEMKEDYMTVKKPLAPKAIMPKERRPTVKDFSIVIVPKGGGEPNLYDVETGRIYPLYPNIKKENEEQKEQENKNNKDESKSSVKNPFE